MRTSRTSVLTSKVSTGETACSSRQHGFTFLEVLMALTLLTILGLTVWDSSVAIVRARERTRWIGESRFLAERILAEEGLGHSPATTIAPGLGQWRIEVTAVDTGDETNRLSWRRWEIAASDIPSRSTVLYLRGSSNSASRIGSAMSTGTRN